MAEIYTGGGVPLRTRMDLCSELFVLRKTIVSASDANKIKVGVLAGRRVQAIRGKLLGHASLTLADEMLVPGFAESHILSALEAVRDKPRHEQIATASYAKGILATIRTIQVGEHRLGMSDAIPTTDAGIVDTINSMLPGLPGSEMYDPVIDECIGLGSLGDPLRDDLSAATNVGAYADESVSSLVKMKAEAYDKAVVERDALYRKYREGGIADLDANFAEYRKFIDEVFAPIESARNEVLEAERKQANNAFARVGSKIIAAVMDESPIAHDDAVKWADAQEVTKQAVARLKKIRYPLDKLRADMAEFYRFTGGRVSLVRIHSKGDKRANATEIESHGTVGTINLSGNFNKRVLWHELAHHMEADPVAKMAAGRFIRRRSVDGKKYSLRSLSGNNGYRKDEAAFKGNFFHPYVGKVYADGLTEVFSMGVESFSDPETLARRAAEDPQTLEFIAGYVKKPMQPLAQAHMALRNIVTAMQEDVTEAAEAQTDGTIKGLAITVELIPDADTAWQGNDEWRLSRYKQLGQFDASGYYLLSGKVRNGLTKRVCNGLLLAKRESSGWLYTSEIPETDQTVVKAMFAIYRKTGSMPSYYSMNNSDYIQRQAQ